MRDLLPCPPCGRQGRPGQGFLAGSNTKEPRGSAPRERDHRGGDHPVPSRTRQLSPPSPRVLQRKAAGGQGVALAEGAFLLRAGAASLRRPRARRAGRGPQGIAHCGPFLRYEVERCLPDASLVLSEVVLIQNEFAVSAVGYVGGFGCYLIVYKT